MTLQTSPARKMLSITGGSVGRVWGVLVDQVRGVEDLKFVATGFRAVEISFHRRDEAVMRQVLALGQEFAPLPLFGRLANRRDMPRQKVGIVPAGLDHRRDGIEWQHL